MGATITALAAILQNNYQIKIQQALNNKILALEIMKKRTVGWNGLQLVIPVHTDRNTGVGFSNTGALPTAGNQGYVDLLVAAKRLYGTFVLDGALLAAAPQGGNHAFVAAMTAEVQGISDDCAVIADKTLFSGGRVVGFINQFKAEGAAADWQFSGDIVKLGDAITTKGSAVTVQVIQLDTYAVLATKTVTAVAAAALTIHIGAALDTTSVAPGFGCAILISDADASLAFLDSEPVGIYGNFANPTHFTVDRTTATGKPALQANCRTASATGPQAKVDISLPIFEQAMDIVEEASGEQVDMVLVHFSQRQKYAAILQGTIHTVVTNSSNPIKDFNGGAGSRQPSYGDLPIKAERFCGKGLAIFLKSDSWNLCELKKFALGNDDGLTLRQVAGSDSFSGFWRWYYQTVCLLPNRNAVIHGLTV